MLNMRLGRSSVSRCSKYSVWVSCSEPAVTVSCGQICCACGVRWAGVQCACSARAVSGGWVCSARVQLCSLNDARANAVNMRCTCSAHAVLQTEHELGAKLGGAAVFLAPGEQVQEEGEGVLGWRAPEMGG